jgi:putative endonuclease
MSRQGLGKYGENLAAGYLERQGLTILGRNVRTADGELDIVARDGDELVFVEVKTRRGDDETAPDTSVTGAKLARLERLAEAYVEDRGLAACAWRVDVISLVIGRGGELVRLDDLTGAYR